MLKSLIESLRPADFRSSHVLFDLPSRGRPSGTLLIACSDLAADPLGLIPTNSQALSVLQNFGNLAPPPGLQHRHATDVEIAVTLQKAGDIVVCGHSCCGVMRTLILSDKHGLPKPIASHLRPARHTKEIVDAHFGRLRGERLLTQAARVNVLVQLANLRATPSIAARLDVGELHLHGWFYSRGVITAYDPHRAEFVKLAQ